MTTYKAVTLPQLEVLVLDLLPLIKKHRIVLLEGILGAGKTTFVQLLAKALGSALPVTSPTFSLLREYPIAEGERIVHADLFRIKDNPLALAELHLNEWCDDKTILCLEWAESLLTHLPKPLVRVQLSYDDEITRTLLIDVAE